MLEPACTAEANRLLAAHFGRPDGVHGLIQWKYSESVDMTMPVAAVDEYGQEILDTICICGTNVRVHQPNCLLSVRQIRMIPMPTCPTELQRWIVCQWNPPPSEDEWKARYGTAQNYPSGGRYWPITCNGRMVKLSEPPVASTAQVIIDMFSSHALLTPAEMDEAWTTKQRAKEWTKPTLPDGKLDPMESPPPGSTWQRIRDQLPSPLAGHTPGKLENVSYPTVPLKPKGYRSSGSGDANL